MVTIHRDLALPPITQTERGVAPPVRQVGRNVDAERQQHIEQYTAHRCRAELCPEAGLLLPPAGVQNAQVEHRQPGPGVDAGPLGRAAQAEGQPAQRHRQKGAVHACRQHLLAVPQHEVRPQQDEKRTVDVNRCQAALGKTHEIQRQQHAGDRRHPWLAGQAAHKAPGQRHQQHAEQRTGEPPSKAGHAEHRNAHHDQILAQRWVGRLVDRHLVQLLITGTAMVNLVKIHTVQLADSVRHSGLLIKQRTAAHCRHQLPRHVAEGQLKQLGVLHGHGQGLP